MWGSYGLHNIGCMYAAYWEPEWRTQQSLWDYSCSVFIPCSWGRAKKRHHCEKFGKFYYCILLLHVLLVTARLAGEALQDVHHLPLILIPASDHRGWVASGDEPGCLRTPEWRLTRRQIAEVTGSPGDGDGCVFGLEGGQAWRRSLFYREASVQLAH